MTIFSLIPKPTASDEVKQSVVDILETVLAEARAGEIVSLVVIAGHPDETWSEWQSCTEHSSAMIGRLEIAKFTRIKSLLEK